ncbi:nitrate- and nitrite sensing domain-containing protein [Marinimicrobium sp. ABcell2]|uniref:nitrate- and nitrite sensing domain-containing protein n=1 Tax=Marinimicrobium sp. ABcell2 TaxID=3069751 RepID=UPI0027B63F74|nr:nitrate- and nitrite sensing domain-containing protein [Marinimicrobium sp. ABcell2]MDQ2077233.1 nitrate- and nitrite sensing domain-containing protein [Marinimicrobium sp. ABcell2]
MKNQTEHRGVAEYLLASKRCDIRSLEQLLNMGQLVAGISSLVHALQLERGASNMYVGSAGERCADIRLKQVAIAEEAEEAFRQCLDRMDTDNHGLPAASRFYSRIAYSIHGLEELRGVRDEIQALKPVPETIIDGYSELIESLLAIVFEAADSAADPDISRILVAMFHLMQGKEFAGQERAVGSAGFAQGLFDERFSKRLRHLIDNQERCFHIFTEFADAEALKQWRAINSNPYTSELERLRRIAFTSAADGKADRELSEAWFALTTERINAIKALEHALEQSLSATCRLKIASAREDLNSHQLHIDELARQPSAPSFAIFFNGASSPHQAGTETFVTGCASPQLGRSLFDLVQSQSQRLQTMSEELQQARAALAERKTIEKAKGMIMKYRSVNEEEAYRFLRQVAMSQNRRLADIAKDTLAMSDLFPIPDPDAKS